MDLNSTFYSFKKLGKSWEFNSIISVGTLALVIMYQKYKNIFCYPHIKSVLNSLQQLLVWNRINFKIFCFTHRVFFVGKPLLLALFAYK